MEIYSESNFSIDLSEITSIEYYKNLVYVTFKNGSRTNFNIGQYAHERLQEAWLAFSQLSNQID